MENKNPVTDRTQRTMEHIMLFVLVCIAAVFVIGLGKFAWWIINL